MPSCGLLSVTFVYYIKTRNYILKICFTISSHTILVSFHTNSYGNILTATP